MAETTLQGARVLVVGGTGELGSRIAGLLVAAGSRVVVSGRALRDGSRDAFPGVVGYVSLDLRDPSSISAGSAAAIDMLGGLDGIVLASGVVGFGPLDRTPPAALAELIQVNLTGPLLLLGEVIPHVSDGFVVALTGVVAEQPPAGMAPYAAAKAGLGAAMTSLARELRRQGVHMLEARPPHTETGLATRPVTGVAPALPRGLEPDHVAEVIVRGLARGERRLEAADFSAGS